MVKGGVHGLEVAKRQTMVQMQAGLQGMLPMALEVGELETVGELRLSYRATSVFEDRPGLIE